MRLLKYSVVFILLLTAACNRVPENREEDIVAIRKVMEQRSQAIASRDIDAYQRLIHSEYNDGRNSRETVIEDMRAAFAAHESISLTYQRAPVELKMNTARLVQRIIYRVDGDRLVHDHEVLILRKSEGVWSMSGGISTGLL